MAVLVGTAKGMFVLRGDGTGPWDVGGPFLRGQEVYALAWDGSGGAPRILAGANSSHWGPSVVWSEDLGVTWDEHRVFRV